MSQRHAGRAGTGVGAGVGAAGIGNVLDVDQANTRVEWLEIDGNDFANNTATFTNTGPPPPPFWATSSSTTWARSGRTATRSTRRPSGGLEQIRNCVIYEIGLDGVHVASNNVRIQNVSLYLTQNGGQGIQIDNAPTGVDRRERDRHGRRARLLPEHRRRAHLLRTASPRTTPRTTSGNGQPVGRAAASQFVSLTAPVDLHLKYGSAAVNAGRDLSATFTDDIDGQTRPLGAAWDVGADEAGAQMLVKSGTYIGNGTSQSIAAVGFQPDLVIITSDSTNANVGTTFPSGHTAVLRTSTMSGNVSKAGYVYNYHPLANRITSLDPNGFSVGHPADHNVPNDEPTDPYHCVNHNSVRYYWTAFKAAPGEMAVGTYTGNGAATQDVTTVGFQPDYTLVLSDTYESPSFATRPCRRTTGLDFDGGSQCPAGCSRSPDSGIRTELANGFRVGTYMNANGDAYHYIAWKQTPGPDQDRHVHRRRQQRPSIAGVGFRPEFVTVSNGVTPIPNTSTVFKTAADYARATTSRSSTSRTPAAGRAQDNIQAIEADGFQVGTDDNVNAFDEPLYYAAFGPGLPTGA